MENKQVDLTGNPVVENQIRQYYIKKKFKQEQSMVSFTEGVANRERERSEFSIDNSYMHKVKAEDLELLERNSNKSWRKHYRTDKSRREYELANVEY